MPLVLMAGKSITIDEPYYIAAGFSYLKTHRITLNLMHPPLIKEVCALPLVLMDVPSPADAATIVREGSNDVFYQFKFARQLFSPDVFRLLFLARIPVAVFSFALAALICRWATDLWGPVGGLIALFCYVFDPTVVAHAQFVTTDVAAAFFSTLFMYWLRPLLAVPTSGRSVRAGIALGLACATKFSMVLLLPSALIILGTQTWLGGETATEPLGRATSDDRGSRIRATFFASLLMIVTAYALLWIVYFCPSDPLFYWRGIRSISADRNTAHYYFFHGQFSQTSWYSYFLVAWLIKTPVPTLIVAVISLILFGTGIRRSFTDELLITVFPVVLLAAVSGYAQPIGVRYLIPCLPFLYIFIGRIGARLAAMQRYPVLPIALFAIWQLVEFFGIWPDHLAYFNQLVGGWRGGVAWLDDSNVDWGQNLVELHDYLERHPHKDIHLCNFVTPFDGSDYGVSAERIDVESAIQSPPSGTLILSAHCEARARAYSNARFADGPENWIARASPTAVVGHTYYVYEAISPTVPATVLPLSETVNPGR
jgi:hypothetical protein